MVGQRRDTSPPQRGGGVLDLGAGQAVDDAGIAPMALCDEGLELGLRAVLFDDFVPDVRSIETRHEDRRTLEREAVDDFLPGQLIGGCGHLCRG